MNYSQVIYVRQGHELYIQEILDSDLYPVDISKLPWSKHKIRVSYH